VSNAATQEAVRRSNFRAVVMGGSAGAMEALKAILPALSPDLALPVLMVQHLHPSDGGAFADHIARTAKLRVVEPCDKESIEPGCIYCAPANYHMLVERSGTIALSVEERVNWSRPSIDVLFESAAVTWGAGLAAVILSGASADGAKGMLAVKKAGGLTIAQDPVSATHPVMPRAAIDIGAVDTVLQPAKIGRLLAELGRQDKARTGMLQAGTYATPEKASR
jgi:two-component system, chemotaxis family, protein-glutamate methylesterase/glutaminase